MPILQSIRRTLRSIFRSNASRFRDQGNRLRDAGRVSEAAGAFGRYLALRPDDFAIWVQRGNCLKDSGALREAALAYETALRLNPGDADLHLQKGHLLKVQNCPDEALKCYKNSYELNPAGGHAVAELKAMGVKLWLPSSPPIELRGDKTGIGAARPVAKSASAFGEAAGVSRDRMEAWYRENEPSEADIGRQRTRQWPSHAPRISLLIQIRESDEVRGVMHWMSGQTYPKWEVVFVAEGKCAGLLAEGGSQQHDRVRFEFLDGGVTADHGLELGRQRASGDLVGVVPASDFLSPTALAEMADLILGNPDTDVVYCDEDCVSGVGMRHGLRLKPDWSPEMLLGFYYVGRLCLIRRGILQDAGGFTARFGDAQEYDAVLRVSERTTRIARLPRCLYHRLAEPGAGECFASFGGEPRLREQAVREYLARRGLDATVTTLPDGSHRAAWPIAKPPLVSIIIPTRDQPAFLKQCVEGLRHKTAYPRIEIILVDNGSTDETVLRHYREWTRAGAVRVVPFDREFNYSAACNHGARFATGELLLFLNNDISVIEAGWLDEMVRLAMLHGVGCVGAMLLYPDGRIQHAGVVLGQTICGHIYHGASRSRTDVYGSADMYRNLLAVTGACQMVRRAAFDAVGGFDERYRLAYSDIVFCLRLRGAGFRTVYTPHAALVHHEGQTRGRANPVLDMELCAMDIGMMGISEDPFFHQALSPSCTLPTLRLDPEPTQRDALQNQIDMSMRKLPAPPELNAPDAEIDLYDDNSVRRLAGPATDSLGIPEWTQGHAPGSESEAARFALWMLRSSPEIRAQFPRALSEGVGGGCCQRLCDQARVQHGWPESAIDLLRGAFRNDPGAAVRRVYESREDLQILFPGARLAVGRARFLAWLVVRGMRENGLGGEQVWWFMLQSAEDPARELAYQYSVTPSWRGYFPDALTETGWPNFYRWVQASLDPSGNPMNPPPLPESIQPG